MSFRSLFLDLRLRQPFICRSCQLNLQRNQRLARFHESSPTAARVRPRALVQSKKVPISTTKAVSKQSAAVNNGNPTESARDDSLRFFEGNMETGEVKQLDGAGDLGHSFYQMQPDDWRRDVAADIGKLAETFKGDKAYKDMDWGGFAREIGDKIGSTRDVREVYKKLGAYLEEIESKIDQVGDPLSGLTDDELVRIGLSPDELRKEREARALRDSPVPQIPEGIWTNSQQRRITKLNVAFRTMARLFRRAETPPAKTTHSAWKTYTQARQCLALSWDSVSADAWALLWKMFSTEGPRDDRNRLTRVAILAKDTSAANVALTPAQQLLTVEAMFVDGWEKNAVDSWKRCMSTLGAEASDTFQEFWELGVRIFCKLGRLDDASRAIEKLLTKQCSPKILMPYIRTCAELNTEDGRSRAWEAYRRLRELLGPKMAIEDYDEVISFFLSSNQTENALYAFVDMMTTGDIDIKGKKHLPSVIANKFFFGKWLKRLIGAGDLKGAHSVVEFMRERGIEASPIQINGLIGAWQRSGGAEDLKRADDMAWDMIRARVNFVQLRKRFAALSVPATISQVNTHLPSPSTSTSTSAATAGRPFAKATLETFCLLAENYRTRQLQDRMLELWDAFAEAEISPDAFMMNQLLESYSDDGDVERARGFYRSFVHDRGIAPDPYTFMALFKMLDANRLQVLGPEERRSEAGLARETFAEMLRFREVFASTSAQSDGEGDGNGGRLEIDVQLARKILHTFRRTRDHVGAALAVGALREIFGFAPPETLVLELVVGSTNLSWDRPDMRRRLQAASRRLEDDVVTRLRGRGIWGGLRGVESLEELSAQERGKEMCEYLQRFFAGKAEAAGEATGEEEYEVAAREMGLYHNVQS